NTGNVPARPVEARNQTLIYWISAGDEANWNCRCRGLCCKGGRKEGDGEHGHLASDEIGRQFWQLIVLTLRIAIFDGYIVALDITYFFQSFSERGREVRTRLGRSLVKETDHGHRWLLRPRRERPCCGRAAEQRDELAPPHSITSSARCWRRKGTSRPSILAVLRLITRSNLNGIWTGRSLGFVPRRMRSA